MTAAPSDAGRPPDTSAHKLADSLSAKWAWLRAVVCHSDRTLGQIAVAAALAQHFNVQHGAAWPAERTISEWTRLDRRNVQRAIAELEAAGFLAVLERGGPRRSTRYALVMDAIQRPQRTPKSVLSGRRGASSEDAVERPEKKGSEAKLKRPERPRASRLASALNARPPRSSRGPLAKF
jgi:hypothetical protein